MLILVNICQSNVAFHLFYASLIVRVPYSNSGHTHHQGLFCERMPRLLHKPRSLVLVTHLYLRDEMIVMLNEVLV
jgi:hypothetical protein